MYTLIFELVAGEDGSLSADEWANARETVAARTIEGKAPDQWIIDQFGTENGDGNWSWHYTELMDRMNEMDLPQEDRYFLNSLNGFASSAFRD